MEQRPAIGIVHLSLLRSFQLQPIQDSSARPSSIWYIVNYVQCLLLLEDTYLEGDLVACGIKTRTNFKITKPVQLDHLWNQARSIMNIVRMNDTKRSKTITVPSISFQHKSIYSFCMGSNLFISKQFSFISKTFIYLNFLPQLLPMLLYLDAELELKKL